MAAKGSALSNGKDLSNWAGVLWRTTKVVDGAIRCKKGARRRAATKDQYGDFVARVEFKCRPLATTAWRSATRLGATPPTPGCASLQVLDTEHPQYAKLDPRQAHGFGLRVIAAHRGYHRPTGDWNFRKSP